MNTAIHDYSIILAGHGSRDPEGVLEFEQLAQLLKERAPVERVDHGYLEFATPTIDQAIRNSIAAGTKKLVMVPALLAAATHAKNDMPSEITALKEEFPEVEMHFGAVMDLHPLLLRLCQQRIVEAESLSPAVIKRSESCLVVVGRGTSDPDANSEISKLTRMLEEGMGFGTSFTCYSGTTHPLVLEGLEAATKLGHKRIVLLPYFLFNGVLVKRIYDAAETIQARNPQLEILKAKYLGVHEDVADVFIERAHEGIEGRANMNCSLCKYRIQIVGYESQVGTPQEGHHLKVKGLNANGSQTANADESKPKASSIAVLNDEVATLPSVQSIEQIIPYIPHPIEAQSMEIIARSRDWTLVPAENRRLLMRLVHTSGDPGIVEDIFISPGAVEAGMRALLRCRRVITDVTMVESGLKRALVSQLGISTWCGVHDRETVLLAENNGITRSAAGVRRAWQKWGNDIVLAIGDAPTAVAEATRLIREHGWRPQLVIGLPVGFVGTQECKEDLRRCLHVPRITNSGTRGGSPWAASAVNALMIEAIDFLTKK
jgi:precorrin-8X/cobalt-precorrin-8 methylmutase